MKNNEFKDLLLPNASVLVGDCIERMNGIPDRSVQMCVTSPPYFGLRDYGHDGQIGLEETPEEFIAKLVAVFREVRRVLADDGTLWVNIGDSYARNPSKGTTGTPNGRNLKSMGYSGGAGVPDGVKEKDLIGIPWMLAFALRADGWYLRQDIIWHKPNPMPESVRDRCTKAHEYIFLMSKSERYFFDSEAMREDAAEPGRKRGDPIGHTQRKLAGRPIDRTTEQAKTRNRRSVWTIATRPYKGAHFATFPPALVEPCILAGSRTGDVVLDPFNGSGTTGQVALQHGRQYLGCELNEDYVALTADRLKGVIADMDASIAARAIAEMPPAQMSFI